VGYTICRFPNFPELKEKDDSEEVINQMNNVYIIGEDIMSQVDKQNLAFRKAAELGIDVILQIDADEWVDIDDMNYFIDSIDDELTSTGTFQFMIPWVNILSSPPYDPTVDRMPRLFLFPDLISCEKVHWWYYNVGYRIIVDNTKVCKGVTMYHDDGVRSKKRNDIMWEFQKVDMARERKLYDD
jgi:hypothetical protein